VKADKNLHRKNCFSEALLLGEEDFVIFKYFEMSGKQFKVVLLGEGRVGKTSLVLRYTQNQFDETQPSTVQASYQTKRLNLDGQSVTIAVWDTAGQERFHALGPIYYRDANGAVLVYDITDNDSFQRVQNWVKELRKMLGYDIALAIVGNKVDLERNRVVPVDKAEAYAESVGAKHFHTSAKLNKGVNEMFLDLTKRMLQSSPAPLQTQKSKGLVMEDDSKAKKKEGCCS